MSSIRVIVVFNKYPTENLGAIGFLILEVQVIKEKYCQRRDKKVPKFDPCVNIPISKTQKNTLKIPQTLDTRHRLHRPSLSDHQTRRDNWRFLLFFKLTFLHKHAYERQINNYCFVHVINSAGEKGGYGWKIIKVINLDV